ncbi:hypothetical protein JDV02_001751 [Purpureocillium takamizusanense]|uniref:Secreted protein n=1 Tax=Purpureocillium takamizusanense TaxID=2060973 RepID=A0A9Q8Q9T0_9HYPO|nr:uncharacterized protein JDV02_001751 [Purpureocillium takamizusanense]UNI15193.1 hypothetical protein JDV02_001751 [Purpureocillium takamizusanense]
MSPLALARFWWLRVAVSRLLQQTIGGERLVQQHNVVAAPHTHPVSVARQASGASSSGDASRSTCVAHVATRLLRHDNRTRSLHLWKRRRGLVDVRQMQRQALALGESFA